MLAIAIKFLTFINFDNFVEHILNIHKVERKFIKILRKAIGTCFERLPLFRDNT